MFHIAYNVIFVVKLLVCPGLYDVPDPFALVFHSLKVSVTFSYVGLTVADAELASSLVFVLNVTLTVLLLSADAIVTLCPG